MRFCIALLLFSCLMGVRAQTDTTALQPDAAALHAILSRYHAQGNFDGTALVGRGGKVVFAQGYGESDRAKHIPATADTPFPICSITKQFTAVLVLQEAAAGKLHLDGKVDTYMPGFRKGDGITVEDLLTHTSGLPNMDAFLPDAGFYARSEPKFSSPAFVIKTYLQGPLTSKPGAKFSYNNADYIVLQAILERVTGKGYARLLQEKIWTPCGMNRTSMIVHDTFAPDQAVGYVTEKGKLVREPHLHYANFGAAGAMYSTARDLFRYSTALDDGTLLPAVWQSKLFTPVSGLGYEGLSTWTYRAALPGGISPLLQERDGAIGGFRTLLLRAPEERLTLILLGNTDASEPSEPYMGRGLPFEMLRVLYAPVPKGQDKR